MAKLSQLGAVLALFAVAADGSKTDLPVGTPSWSLAGDPTVATLTPSADGLSATIAGVAAAGSVTVTASIGGFTKTDTFEFDGVVVAPPAPAPAVAIDWTVTAITADASTAS